MIERGRLPSSFRDPSGFVFEKDGVLYRQIQAEADNDLKLLIESGLQGELVQAGLVVPFEQVDVSLAAEPGAAMVIQPQRVPFISYPYEWSFGQLKAAALATLEIARRSLEKGMILKDASAYNIQFVGHRPVLIDTLSFEPYQEGSPWNAYKQFCQHFLAPLALMALCDIRLGSLLETHIDGIDVDLASGLLPGKTKFSPGLLTHIHLHAKAAMGTAAGTDRKANLSKLSLFALLDNLKGTINGLNWNPTGTEWGDYYDNTNYSEASLQKKRELVGQCLDRVRESSRTCWDLGANNGEFSRLAVERGLFTIAWDIDPAAVEQAYRYVDKQKSELLLPLKQDLRNPSPSLGWHLRERYSLIQRGPADVVLALALVHHIAIGNNTPLGKIAEFLADVSRQVIIEFVPKEDSQVQRMLVARKDIFAEYDEAGFESAFATKFETVAKLPIEGTHRTLYLFARRG